MQNADTDLCPNVDQDVEDIDESENDANIQSSRGMYTHTYWLLQDFKPCNFFNYKSYFYVSS